MHYMYADLENGIFTDTQMMMGRLKKMSASIKTSDGKGTFMVRARSYSRRASFMKGIMHWFRFISLVEKLADISLRRHQAVQLGREFVAKNHIYAAAHATDRLDEIDPRQLDQIAGEQRMHSAHEMRVA